MQSDYYGLETRSIENGHLRLEFLAKAGPRIVRMFVAGSEENLFAELPDQVTSTPYGNYFFRGGHRLWHAPESLSRTYMPDNDGLAIQELADGVRLVQPTEPVTGIIKSIEIHFDPQRPELTLLHQLQNDGVEPIEVAPWAITQLKLGGVAILPQPRKPLDKDGLLPNRSLVLWSYTRWHDPRLELREGYIAVQGHSELPACKVGYLNRDGWIGYFRNQILFIKRFQPAIDSPHPDFNCNAEVYCGDRFIELETLAPMVRLEPHQSTSHRETWQVRTEIASPQNLGELVETVSMENFP